jgi:hypothetical protein
VKYLSCAPYTNHPFRAKEGQQNPLVVVWETAIYLF